MTHKWLATGAAIALIANLGCGKSAKETQVEKAAADAKQAAKAMTETGGDVAKGMQDMAKAMQGMATVMGGGDGKTVEPVPFQALETALPQVSGWEMAKPESERMTSPIAYSQTEVDYTKGDARVTVKIVDTGFAQMLVAPWSMMMAMGYSKESSNGYEKATTVGGSPGFEKWSKEDKNGELNVFAAKRFLVSIEGHDLSDTKVLHEFASKMDMGKLADLK